MANILTRHCRKNTLAMIVAASPFLIPSFVWAYSSGISGYSGITGSTCIVCHTGGIAPSVALSGPMSVEAGSVNSYTFSMTGGQATAGGFNISASAGTLSISMAGATSEAGELRHTQPFTDSGNGIEWTFSFTAPVTAGSVTLYATALSANGNFQMTGDNAASTTLTIEVNQAQKPLPPSASLGSNTLFAQPGDSIQFDASASSDGDGTITRYLWDFGDGSPFTQGVNQVHAYGSEGSYTVTLAATDNDGLTGATAITITVSSNAGSAQGETLYNQYCFACHGAGGSGGSAMAIIGVSSTQINNALASIGAMQSISLSAEQIQFIADYLASGGGEPPPRPTDGAGLFSMFCAACHGADGRGGSAKGVTGASLPMVLDGIANIPAMQAIDLSSEELQKVADFLTAGGGGDIPGDGNGLYSVFCSVCHGAGGHGGKFFAVTGASNPMIREAFANVEWMQPLAQLQNSQTQQIAEFLGAGGEPPLPLDAPGLYSVFCEVCHGPGGHGGKFKAVSGAPAAMIRDAINNEPWMSSIAASPTQIGQIADFLSAGGAGTLPADGAGLFGVFCAVCHGADGRGGTYKVVSGTNATFINRALNNVSLMTSLQVNSTQVNSVASFLASGGGGSKPSTGSGLFHVYCETCHGPNGQGGPEENVRGVSAGSISSALDGESAMRHLRPYLTSGDISLISSFLNN